MLTVKQAQASGVRACLCLHFLLVVWRVTVSWTDQYWLLAAAIVPFLLEAVFTVVKRDGVEWRLFSLSFFFYLCATLPGIWLLEIHRTNTHQDWNCTTADDLDLSGIKVPVCLSPDTWVMVIEEMMLYLMIMGRWILPRGDVGREQLTQVLFGFIGIASDIMELFSLFDEDPEIRNNTTLNYVILGMWSLSVLQFTLTFTTANRPRKARGLRASPAREKDPDSDLHPDNESDIDQDIDHDDERVSVLRVELLASVLSLLMQDGPFLGIRLFTMIHYELLTYSLVFFTTKNVFVILLLLYKIFILIGKLCCPKRYHYDDESNEKVVHDFDQNTAKIFPNNLSRDHKSGEIRKRGKGEKQNGLSSNQMFVDMLDVGELQKVIDGPATPAKSMDKTRKYDKLSVSNEMMENTDPNAETDVVQWNSEQHDNQPKPVKSRAMTPTANANTHDKITHFPKNEMMTESKIQSVNGNSDKEVAEQLPNQVIQGISSSATNGETVGTDYINSHVNNTGMTKLSSLDKVLDMRNKTLHTQCDTESYQKGIVCEENTYPTNGQNTNPDTEARVLEKKAKETLAKGRHIVDQERQTEGPSSKPNQPKRQVSVLDIKL